MANFIVTIPLSLWLLLLIILATVSTHLVIHNKYYTLFTFLFSSLLLLLILSMQVLSQYLASHVIGTLGDEGLGAPYSRNGWALLLDAWPLWLVPTVIGSSITGLLCAWFIPHDSHGYLEVIQQAGKSEQSNGPTATTSKMVLKQMEINDLHRKLEIAEEKYRQAKGESTHKPVRLDRYLEEINVLRHKIPELEKLITRLKTENKQLSSDLTAAQKLIDDLMSR